jgi:regulator of sigma E protease
MELLSTLLWFVLALGLLVTAHEYGHYWVARRLGIKILRFSVGFGRPLWRYRPGETEFVIAAVPLGGYVKMLDEREGEVESHELHRAFNRQPLAVRSAVVAAGPIANFLFAFAAYWLMLVLGVTGPRAVIGEVAPDSIAARAGLQQGFEIVQVDGTSIETWDGVFRNSLDAILDGRSVEIVTISQSGSERRAQLDFSGTSVDDIGAGDFFAELGVTPVRPRIPPIIGRVVPDEPAARAGMQPGDRIVAVEGRVLDTWDEWVELVRANPDRQLAVTLSRGGNEREFTITPMLAEVDGKPIGRIGAEVQLPEMSETVPMGVERYGPMVAAQGAMERTAQMSVTTLKILYKIVVGEASVKNLSGPISVAHYAGAYARMGVARFLEFLALVSVSLAVLNLLPIPVLDGGHLMYYLLESVARRPVSEKLQAVGQQVGLVILLGLMGIAVYNDILRML